MNPNDVCAGAAPVGELDVDEVEAHLTASGSCDEAFADPDGHLWQVRERYDADERR